MIHVISVYLANIPLLGLWIVSFFGWKLTPLEAMISLCYITNIINWVAGYHWTLSMQTMERRIFFASIILSLLSLWSFFMIFHQDYQGARYLLSALLSIQLYCDFHPEISYFVSPHMKIARILSTLFLVYVCSSVIVL